MTWVTQVSPMSGDSSAFVNDAAISSTGIIVAVGASDVGGAVPPTVLVMWSEDGGVTWTEAWSYPWDDSGSFNAYYVTWSEFLGGFLACGYTNSDGSVVCTSPEGDVWTTMWTNTTSIVLNKPISCEALGIVSIPGTDYTGADSGVVLTTTDGAATTLHTGTVAMTYPQRGAWSDADGAAVVAGNGPAPAKPLNRSTDGINYTGVASPMDDAAFARGEYVSYLPTAGVWLANGSKGGGPTRLTVRSTDGGATWATTPVPNDFTSPAGELTDGRILVADTPTGAISADGGVTWTDSPLNPFAGQATAVLAATSFNRDVLLGYADNSPGYDVVVSGTPVRVVPRPGPGGVGGVGGTPLWKYFIASLDGTGISDYSKLARDRVCEVVLNAPLMLRGGVPSDNPQVNLVYTDDGYDDPYLNEGTRLLWGFRRESDTSPYYTVRAGTLINLVGDTAEQDDATSAFTGWDPWHYLFSRPVCNVDGSLPGKDGLSFSNTQAAVVIATLLQNTIDNHGFTYIDAGTMFSGSYQYTGNLETSAGMEIDIVFQQGTSVGQAWQQVCDLGVCDIILEPVYAPAGRILTDFSTVYNFLVQLNVYAQAGSTHDELIFAWNLPGRSLTRLSRIFDGSSRANNLAFQAGQGGVFGAAPVVTDAASETKFGEYWAQQFFPGVTGPSGISVVTSLAEQQLALRNVGRETVTFSPAPERSPRPWQDYNLGDRVPVWASRAFRDLLGEESAERQYQRIYGWTANISDDALETIDPVLTSPEGFTA
jgi:hypothetical protein